MNILAIAIIIISIAFIGFMISTTYWITKLLLKNSEQDSSIRQMKDRIKDLEKRNK